MKYRLRSYSLCRWMLAGFFLLVLTGSCVKDASPIPENDGNYIVLSLSLPSFNNTRALQEDDENSVTHIYVLLFDYDTGKYIEKVEGTNITDGASSRYKQFRVVLEEGHYDLMIIANSEAAVDNANLIPDLTRDEVVERLKYTMTEAWGYETATMTPFPMWGDLYDVQAQKGIDLSNRTCNMFRAVVRIDVILSDEVYDKNTKDELVDVFLYNRYTQGQIVPTPGNYIFAVSDSTFVAPSIPLGAGKLLTPLYYGQQAAQSMRATIYTFEALAGDPDDLLNNTCLVIGLGDTRNDGASHWEEDPGMIHTRALSDTWYYRIDFRTTDEITGQETWLPLLRNTNYEVTVNEKLTTGFRDPDMAFRSHHYGLEYEIVPYQLWGTTDVQYGQYRLDISSTSLSNYYGGESQEVIISTTHPDGWTFAVSTSEDRIEGTPDLFASVTAEMQPAPANTAVKLFVNFVPLTRGGTDPGGDPGGPPLGGYPAYIHIKAGNLTNVIKAQNY